MLTLYVIAAVLGGVFVLLSAVGGLDKDSDFDKDFEVHGELDLDADVDADLDVDADADLDADADVEAETGVGHGADADHSDVWLPFLSMRFWTYFLAFFGTTGLLLTWLWQEGVATALLSGGMGLACGLGMAYGTRYLKSTTIHSGAGIRDLVGAEGTVLFGVSSAQVGKIRCHVKGRDVDLIATTDDDEVLEPGARVLLIGFDQATARVVRAAYATRGATPLVEKNVGAAGEDVEDVLGEVGETVAEATRRSD